MNNPESGSEARPDTGYYPGPWPAEDGGSARLQVVAGSKPEGLRLAASRSALFSTMTVLGDPGEVFLLRHSLLRSRLGLPTTAQVERIDADTLKPLARSPRLPGGPMWPGGLAIHRNGDIYVAYGRWMHRLRRSDCSVAGALELPTDQPHNSFVILDAGVLVTKNISDQTPARLCIVSPDSLRMATAPVEAPEPSIARLSARGNTVYLVGTQSIMRFAFDGTTLVRDEAWRCVYADDAARSYGWDVVLGDRHAWFMDNGRHRYVRHMIGRGVGRATNRLIRVSLDDANDWQSVEISGLPGGAITNPPLWDEGRQIVVGYDSANSVMHAFRFDEQKRSLSPIWKIEGIGCASHMLFLQPSGTIVTNDFRKREAVVLIDIESGARTARAETGGRMQGVVFPSPGWNDDIYWCSFDRLARISLREAAGRR